MSSVIDSCSYQNSKENKCPNNADGKHNYKIVSGSPPSCKLECTLCGNSYYTK